MIQHMPMACGLWPAGDGGDDNRSDMGGVLYVDWNVHT